MNSDKTEQPDIKVEEEKNIEVDMPKSRKRLKERYPDMPFESDEDWENGYNNLFDENEKYRAGEASINELIKANPELLDFLIDMKENKMPSAKAVAKHYGLDYAPSDDEDAKDWERIYGEKLAKAKEKEETDAMLSKNEEGSLAAIDAFLEEQGFDDAQKEAFKDDLMIFIKKVYERNLDKDFLSAFQKNRSYDSDIKAAEEAARISAKNEKIRKEREKEKAAEAGDGLPPATDAAPPDASTENEPVSGITMENYYRNKNKSGSKFI